MDYCTYKMFIKSIKNRPDLKVSVIGKSVLNKNIYAILKTNGASNRWAVITAAIHAREHLSCDVICKIINLLPKNISLNYNIAFVPMINPDGVDLCIHGIKSVPKNIRENLIELNDYQTNFMLYKANINGVDLNNNWDANWQTKFSQAAKPCASGFYGYLPMTEPEVKALRNFTLKLNPFITINYHLKGEEIYYDFFQPYKNYCRDKNIAKVFSDSTGYKIVPTQHISSGGYKDWCVLKLGIPSLTIELGADKFMHPYPTGQVNDMYVKNKDLINCLNKAFDIYNTYNHFKMKNKKSLKQFYDNSKQSL